LEQSKNSLFSPESNNLIHSYDDSHSVNSTDSDARRTEADGLRVADETNNNQDIIDSNNSPASTDLHNTNSQMSETNTPLSNSKNQIRKAASTSAHTTATITTNLFHVSHLSQPPLEAITQFFYDEPYLPYRPPLPHQLEDSPCKSIIRIDNHSLFYCTLHPDIQSYHLESIEHHIKFKNPNIHKSEILKSLKICPPSTRDL
jgi:hypothetical protein